MENSLSFAKHVMPFFCYEEQKTILKNSNQTVIKFFIYLLLLYKITNQYKQLIQKTNN